NAGRYFQSLPGKSSRRLAMVISPSNLFAEVQSAAPVLERLDPPRRAAVVMALLALVLVGLLLVLIAMLGGHWVRRLARHRPGKRRPVSASPKQINEIGALKLTSRSTGETIQLNAPS